jgi:hypothetical protein
MLVNSENVDLIFGEAIVPELVRTEGHIEGLLHFWCAANVDFAD